MVTWRNICGYAVTHDLSFVYYLNDHGLMYHFGEAYTDHFCLVKAEVLNVIDAMKVLNLHYYHVVIFNLDNLGFIHSSAVYHSKETFIQK